MMQAGTAVGVLRPAEQCSVDWCAISAHLRHNMQPIEKRGLSCNLTSVLELGCFDLMRERGGGFEEKRKTEGEA